MVRVHRRRVTQGEGAGAWAGLIGAIFGQSDMNVGEAARFHGEVMHARLGDALLSQVVSTRERSERNRRHVERDRCERFVLVNVVTGSVELDQGRCSVIMPAGSFTLYDSARPMTWTHASETRVRNVALPAALVRARIRQLETVLCRPRPSRDGLWRLTSSFLDSLLHQLGALPEVAAHSLGGQLFELIALALEADDEGFGEPADTRARARHRSEAFIRGHLSDPALAPKLVAAAGGMSSRALHRLYQDTGDTVSELIRRLRLERCRDVLADPGISHLPIAEIAYRAGFRSQAHFAHAFRHRYGCSASAWRAEAAMRRLAQPGPGKLEQSF